MTITGQEPTPTGQVPKVTTDNLPATAAPAGQPPDPITDPAPEADASTLSAAELAAALAEVRRSEAATRRKLRDAEAKIAADAQAKTAEAEKLAAEQGKFQELYEAEKARAAALDDRIKSIEYDQLRQETAAAAGIPQLWNRLQGGTADELAADAKSLSEAVTAAAPAGPASTRTGTQPTPAPQGQRGLTDDERRAKARSTW